VMTEGTDGQGACFPPAVAALNAPWPSEGNLTQRLVTLKGKDFAAKAFEAHRHQFITEDDLSAMASLNLQVIRVPLTWAAFADALAPLDKGAYGSHNPEYETRIVPDPFYNETSMFATVPRQWLAGFFRRAAAHGLQVLIDLHAFPGGSAQGTYNGIWPQDPVFWNKTAKLGNGSVPLKQIGLWITEALVKWVEGLDKEAQDAVAGITMMNEPAHMAAFVNFAKETDVLDWLAASANQFRNSTLPALGKKLYVQVIGTAFKDFDGTVLPWFFDLFSQEDRSTWAVMDQHWYTAWDNGGCDGKLSADGGFRCDDPIENITRKLRSCAGSFASGLHQNYGSGLTAVTEFSVGTSEKARYACTDRHVLKVFFQEQVRAFNQFGIQPFFWTWRMPFGLVFEPGWSLRWLAGLEEPKPSLPCLAPWALKENIVG
jgi:aryl-phospho-beta-D-glucosidase BglC (GH1 family)